MKMQIQFKALVKLVTLPRSSESKSSFVIISATEPGPTLKLIVNKTAATIVMYLSHNTLFKFILIINNS